MDMKKTAKKIAALVAGTTMIGATIMGATAQLENYPAPFVSNGVFNGKIVVGAAAATSDVVGAIDIAASLQAESTSSSEVNVPGVAGTATVSGDSAEFKTSSNVVAFEEQLGTVKQTFTASELAALKSGVLSTGSSTTPVKQYLKFDNTTMRVVYDEDSDNDKLGDYLLVPDASNIFEYQLEFTEGAESDVDADDDSLEDLENEQLTILGAPFTIVDSSLDFAAKDISLTLLGGQVADVLRDGETKTYTIDGTDYEVTAVFIADNNGGAKLSVNGVITKELDEGETEVLGEDVTVGIQSILTNQREGLVEFFLGANKVELTDTDYQDTTYTETSGVEVREETVDNTQLIIKATNASTSSVKLNYIKYRVQADDDHYVPAGAGVKEVVEDDNEGAFLTDTWDIWYAGLVKTGSTMIEVNSVSDHSYELEFVNNAGDMFTVPVMTNKDGNYKWGDDDDDLVFTEWEVGNAADDGTIEANSTTVGDNDYFVVSDKSDDADDDAITRVLRYQSVNTGDSTVTFKDLSGSDIVVSFTGTVGTTATGDLIVDGVTHKFWVGGAADNNDLAIDLDGDGGVTAGSANFVPLVTEGGAILKLARNATTQLFDGTTGQLSALGDEDFVNLTVRTIADRFDETGSDEVSHVKLEDASSNEVDLSVTQVGGASAGLVSDPDADDYDRGYSSYGAFFELFNPSSGDDAAELSIDYPLAQRYPQVFVTAGTVEVMEGAETDGGSLTTEKVNPIAVGLAVLDTDAPAVGSAKMIVVGGPCVNVVAAELMGNPTDCAEGFSPGKAVIKLFTSKNALLVAGYSAQDTLGASYVLADYADYDLSGDEVEVVVADLNTITVNTVE